MRTEPRPTRSEISLYYPADYGPYVETRTEPGFLRRLGGLVMDSRATHLPSLRPGSLLEIGCASGNFLVEMKRGGWKTSGVERDVESARRARERTGDEVFCGGVEDAPFSTGSFDLICAWMTLEHLHDPLAALKRCVSWLRPGGWIALSVPDSGNWQFRSFRENWFALHVPAHLHHFTKDTLLALLEEAGFEGVRFFWQRTLFDVPMSLAYVLESRFGARTGTVARAAANTMGVRLFSRLVGALAAPARLTGRLTVWARPRR
jgi:SAM-dependent methyltransferase